MEKIRGYPGQSQGPVRLLGIRDSGGVHGQSAFLCHHPPPANHHKGLNAFYVRYDNQIGAFSRGYAAQVPRQVKVLRHVQGGHPDGLHRVQTQVNGLLNNMVHMPELFKVAWPDSIRYQYCPAQICFHTNEGFNHFLKLPPHGSFPDHGEKTLA